MYKPFEDLPAASEVSNTISEECQSAQNRLWDAHLLLQDWHYCYFLAFHKVLEQTSRHFWGTVPMEQWTSSGFLQL